MNFDATTYWRKSVADAERQRAAQQSIIGRAVISRVARKEFTEMTRDGRYRWAAGLVFALLLMALLSGWLRYAETRKQHEAARLAERERWLNQGEKSPHSGAHYGVYVFKPLMPLSVIDNGIKPYVGSAAHLEAHNQNIFQYKPAEDSTSARRFGELTAATTFQTLIPLLIILLAYATFAGEREQGTLRQLLSLGVRRRDLALGKALGATAPLLVALIPAAIVGAVTLGLVSGVQALFGYAARLLLMALGYLAYFGSFVGLTLTVSAFAATARQALLALLAFWFIGCLMAPPVVTDVARLLHPDPTALDFAAAIREDRLRVTTWYQRLAKVEARLLQRYGVESAEKLPVSPKGVALMEEEAEGDRIQEARFNALDEAHARQSRVYQFAALVAPLLAVRSLSAGLAGTDYAQHRHFAEAAEQYRRQLVKIMNEDDAANSKPDAAPYLPTLRGRDLWEKVHPFEYTPPSLGWVVQRQLHNIVILLCWLAASSAAAWIAVAKLKVVRSD
jgi:ABC-2 type transport system permease protein